MIGVREMKKYFALIVAILLAVPLVSSAYAVEDQSNSVHMYIVAVSKVHGKLIGEYSLLNVTVVRSREGGHVYVEGYPLHDLTFDGAAWLAAKVACSILGVNFYSYNYYFSISSQTFLIEGPSAGAAMTIGVISAILGEKPRKDVVITGMIMPGGIIGPVGGLSEKIYGAEEAGAKVFIVPLGQVTPELKERGLQLGIEVVGALTIYQALPYFIGKNVTLSGAEGSIAPLNQSYLKKSCNSSLPYIRKELERIEAEEGGNVTFGTYLREWISEAENATREAAKYFAEGEYYTCLSKLFQANISIQASRFLLSYVKAEDKPRYLGSLFQNVSKNVTAAVKLVKGSPTKLSASKFEILAASQERAIEAKYYLEEANATLGSPSTVPSFIHDLAYANARAGTARWWYYFPVENGGMEINVYEKVTSFLGDSEALLTYAERCGVLNSTYSDIAQVQHEISIGISENMLPGVFSLSAELQGEIMGYFLGYYFVASQNSTIVEELLKDLKRDAHLAILNMEKNGTEAIVPKAYYEFANYLYGLGKDFRLSSGQLYWTAKVIASSLSSKAPAHLKEVPEYQPIRLSNSNGISAEVFLIIGIVSGIVIGSLVFSKREKEGGDEKGDIERRDDWNIFIIFSILS